MLLTLIAPAFALSVPVRATFREEVWPGEQALVSVTTTAAAAVYDGETGVRFAVSNDELTANKREATGKGRLSFLTSPGGSVRSWAVYYIGADGSVLGDPDVVTVSFDAAGNGNVAAGTGARLAGLSLAVKKSGGDARWFDVTAKAAVQDTGANASYLGIVELSSNQAAADLVPDPDMDVMDANVYATFQAESLDAILPLDAYTLQLDGTVSIDGLSTSKEGVVQSGKDLEWHIGVYMGEVECAKGGACTPVVSETLQWFEPIGPLKKKSQVAPRVNLRATDVVFETYDAGMSLSIEGDVRSLEVSAAMDLYEASKAIAGSDVVTLDPSGLGVQAKSAGDDTGPIVDIFIDSDTDIIDDDDDEDQGPPPSTPTWAYFANDLYSVTLLDSSGRPISVHDCTLDPTPRTVAGVGSKQVLVGSCTSDPSGTEVRRLQLSIGAKGHMQWKVDLASPAFAVDTVAEGCKAAECAGTGASALGGKVEIARDGYPLYTRQLVVNETSFDLPFAFEEVPEGLSGSLAIDVYAPGPVTWTVKDGVATATDASGVVASFNLEDVGVSPTGGMTCRDWTAEAATAKAGSTTEPLSLSKGTTPNCVMDKVDLEVDVDVK